MHPAAVPQELAQIRLFQALSSEQLLALAHKANTTELCKGESLFEQGARARRFYYLVSGRMKLFSLSPAGAEKVLEIVDPKSLFAQALVFMDQPKYPLNATALRKSELIGFDINETIALLRQSTETLLAFGADLSTRLVNMVQEVSGLSLRNGTCRVAMYLLSQNANGSGQLQLDLPKKVPASRLSLQPESLSRILRSLADDGLVEVQGHTILIQNPDALARLGNQCMAASASG